MRQIYNITQKMKYDDYCTWINSWLKLTQTHGIKIRASMNINSCTSKVHSSNMEGSRNWETQCKKGNRKRKEITNKHIPTM